MKKISSARSLRPVLAAAAALSPLAGCHRPSSHSYQGYLDAEFVYVAAPLAGRLETLSVKKGARVDAGAPLFALECAGEIAARLEAAERLRQSESRLADLQKGQRPTELAALEARLAQARSGAELSARELERASRLHEKEVIADDDYDRARLAHDANLKLVAEIEARLATARLGGRADTVDAAKAGVAAARAALARADWNVSQKEQAAPRAGLVFDTLFREGEYVPAGQPVVALLPPDQIKARFFVPEADFASLHAGQAVRVHVSGRAPPLTATISYLSPRPEYTPPVLYNRENRAKLVFMIEALFPAETGRDLHPGQPVDVEAVR